jgi:hypothetical protein
MRWEWRGPMSLSYFQVAFSKMLVFALQHTPNRWLVDLSTVPPLGLDEQEWLSEIWLPCAQNLPLRHLAVVLPGSLHNQLVLESVIQEGQQYFNANMQFFADTTTGLDWLTGSAQLILDLEQEWQAAHVGHLQA